MKESVLMLFVVLLIVGCTDKSPQAKVEVSTAEEGPQYLEMPSWVENMVIGEIDLKAMTEVEGLRSFPKYIPLIESLGINAILLKPLFPIGQTYELDESKNCLSYKRLDMIDPAIGSMSDFKEVIDLLHLNNIKVLFDWPLNKTGFDNIWLDEHHLWFKRTESNRLLKREETDAFCLASLDYYNNGMRRGMIEVMSNWVKEYGLDGFRFDAEKNIANTFWIELHDHFFKSGYSLLLMASNSTEADYKTQHFHALEALGFQKVLSALARRSSASKAFNEYATKSDRELGKEYFFHSTSSLEGGNVDDMTPIVLVQNLLVLMLEGIPMVSKAVLTPILLNGLKDAGNQNTTIFSQQLGSIIELKRTNGALINDPYLSNTSVVDFNDRFVHFKREVGANRVDVIINLTDKLYRHSFSAEYKGINYLTGEREHWYPQADQELAPYGFKIMVKEK